MKELKRLFTRKMIHRRVFSSLMAMMLVITSVIHPINIVPAYATSNWLEVNYQKQAKNDIELYVQAESASFEPGETITLDLFVQNNSSEEYTDFGISFKDNKDAFAEAEFILTDDCGEAFITEKGSVTNLYLAPGETKALQFEGTLHGGLDVLNRKEITFLCGGYDVNGEAVTTTTEFPFTVGLFNELSIDFTDGTELIPDENNTLEITIGFNDIGYYYDTDVATDSDAKVNTDSNADLATDSDADLATDSDADYVFDLTNVTLDLETVGVKFEKVKLEEASINEENGTITALVSYKVDEDAEAGEYFGTVEANVKNGKKVYQAQTGFQFEVEDVTDSTFKKSGLFTVELDNFTVNVEVPEGAFEQKVELSVTELAENSEEFKTAEEAMEASEKEYDGMMALDICFINEAGEEVEPNEGYNVQVSIEMNVELLPENLIDSSLMVHHFAETTTDNEEKEIVVEDVADVQTSTDGTIDVKEEVLEAKFEIDNFSTYAVTWSTRAAGGFADTVDTSGIIKIDVTDFGVTTIGQEYGGKDYRFRTGGSSHNQNSGWMNAWTDTIKSTDVGTNEQDKVGSSRGVVQGIVRSYLNTNGYPDLVDGNDNKDKVDSLNDNPNLRSFFAGDREDCNYLFQIDSDGYYYYDSSKNFAHLGYQDEETDEWIFEVYDHPKYDAATFNPASNPQFLPFNDINDRSTNYLFGTMIEFDFIMPKDGKINGKDMIFSFAGDDDVWVFIDDVLVLDMGGVHLSCEGEINFANGNVFIDKICDNTKSNKPITFGKNVKLNDLYKNASNIAPSSTKQKIENVKFIQKQYYDKDNNTTENVNVYTDYSKHTLKFFYMERGQGGSNCDLRFNLQPVPQKSLTVTKELVTAAGSSAPVVEYVKNSVDYKFRVVRANEDGTSTNINYFEGKTPGYVILENGEETEKTGTVDSNGYFYLKAGQSACFENMMQYDNDNDASTVPKYVVEEIMPNTITGQYDGVGYDISGAGGTREEGETNVKGTFTSFVSPDMKADLTQAVTFNNKVVTEKLSALYIEKEAAEGSEFTSEDVFDMKVFFKHAGSSDLEAIAAGTEYQWTHLNENGVKVTTTETVKTKGIIKLRVGEAANMLVFADTEFVVYEDTTKGGFTPTYEVEIAGKSIDLDDILDDNGHVTGKLSLGESVSITVTNELQKTSVEIPFEKILTNADGNPHEYTIKLVKVEEDNSEPDIVTKVVEFGENDKGRKTISDNFILSFVDRDFNDITSPVTFNYEMSEVDQDSLWVDCDETVYNVAVTLTKTNGKITPTYVISKKGEASQVPAVFTNTLLSSVTICKKVTGSLGDLNKAFSFTATAAAGTFVKGNIDGECIVKTDGSQITFNLAHGGAITINKLPLGTQIVVQENYEKGANETIAYTVSVNQGDESVDGKEFTTTIEATNFDIIFTNRKEAIPDTGISMDTLPYILIMLAVIGGIAFTIIRRRKEDELD